MKTVKLIQARPEPTKAAAKLQATKSRAPRVIVDKAKAKVRPIIPPPMEEMELQDILKGNMKRFKAACGKLKLEPGAFIRSATEAWMTFAEVSFRPVDETGMHLTEPLGDQMLAVWIREAAGQADPRRRHSMLSGIHCLIQWNPAYTNERDLLAKMIDAELRLCETDLFRRYDTDTISRNREPFAFEDVREICHA